MSEVKLISVTPDAEKTIAFIARVSSDDQNNPDYVRLVKYLIKHNHYSPFEHGFMTLEITTGRDISPQILRHRSFYFQEFCISGDSLITMLAPNGTAKKMTIKKLYKRQKWKNYKNIKVRVYDENEKKFTSANFKEVFDTGVKPCFKITLQDGKQITCTKEHKFLTKEKGWLDLETITNLKLSGKTASMSNPLQIASNGIYNYQSKEHLELLKKESIENKQGLKWISEKCEVSYHTIRKWLKKLGLQYTKHEVASYTESWNKGRGGYKVKERTLEQKLYIKSITPTGINHHSYKGGASSKRRQIANYFKTFRPEIFKKFNYTCQMCFAAFDNYGGKIDLHHVKEVGLYPELAYDIDNVIPVHRKCHMQHHGKSHFFKTKGNGKGNTLVPRYQNIIKIEYVGEIQTYDMEVDHPSHNYVANGICTHNSQRYSEIKTFDKREARRQDTKNRQNSIDDMDQDTKVLFQNVQADIWKQSKQWYDKFISLGVAKECARSLLPLQTETKMYMTGNVRSWMHYIQLRTANGTQKEHMDIANQCKDIFIEQFPIVSQALEWKKFDNTVHL